MNSSWCKFPKAYVQNPGVKIFKASPGILRKAEMKNCCPEVLAREIGTGTPSLATLLREEGKAGVGSLVVAQVWGGSTTPYYRLPLFCPQKGSEPLSIYSVQGRGKSFMYLIPFSCSSNPTRLGLLLLPFHR